MKDITDIYLYYSQENYTQQAIVNVQIILILNKT